MKKYRGLLLVAWSIISIGIVICFYYLIILYNDGWSFWGIGEMSIEKTGQFGDYIGGFVGTIFSLAAFIFLFLTFKQQTEVYQRERLETKFFEMIKLHRDNVSELIYTPFKRIYGKTEKEDILKEQIFDGRMVFRVIFSEFKVLHEEVKHFFDNVQINDLYEENYLIDLNANETLQKRTINLILFAKIDILFCIIYFGLSYDDQKAISNFFSGRYKESFYKKILKYAALKPKEESDSWRKWNKINELELTKKIRFFERLIEDWESGLISRPIFKPDWEYIDNAGYSNLYYNKSNYKKYYGGHQFRLGHYFRNLYQTVTFINNDPQTNYSQKYSNIKILRGQLSTFEQSIIFLNSLSILGRVWELENRNDPQKAIDLNNQLITKYNFIKNILNYDIIEGVNVSHFYPLVEFEAGINEEKKKQRELLEEQYS